MSTNKHKKPNTNLESARGPAHGNTEDMQMKHYPKSARRSEFHYRQKQIIGKGAFGVVFKSEDANGNPVAVKKVLLDPHYKNRELSTLKKLKHRNCIKLVESFNKEPKEEQKSTSQSHSSKHDNKTVLFIVMDYLPQNLHRFSASYRDDPKIPLIYLQLFSYQIFAGLDYLHTQLGITHRDIKPENILIDTSTGELKICDFGSAKALKPGDKSVSYIASRYYRAPELILECTSYTPAVDVWAAGCVIAEILLRGRPLFHGINNDDQMTQMVKILGPPSEEDLSTFEHPPVKFDFERPSPASYPVQSRDKLLLSPPNYQSGQKHKYPFNPSSNNQSNTNINQPTVTVTTQKEKPPSIVLTGQNGQLITRKVPKDNLNMQPTIEKPKQNKQKLEIQISSNIHQNVTHSNDEVNHDSVNEDESKNDQIITENNENIIDNNEIPTENTETKSEKNENAVDLNNDIQNEHKENAVVNHDTNNEVSNDKNDNVVDNNETKSDNNEVKSENNNNVVDDTETKSDNNEIKSENNDHVVDVTETKSANNEVKSDSNENAVAPHRTKSDEVNNGNNEQAKPHHRLVLKRINQKVKDADNDSHASNKKAKIPNLLKQTTTLKQVLPSNTPGLLLNLLESILVYDVDKRPTAKECMKHRFFSGLFSGNLTLPNHSPLPPLDRPV